MRNRNNNINNNINNLASSRSNETYSSSLFKFMSRLFDKYGIVAVDWAGGILGLNKNGKTISNQTIQELTESLKELSEKLKDPALIDVFIQTIKDVEPILQELIISMLNVVSASGRFVARDIITFVCYETPVAPICGLVRFVDNTIAFGEELLDSGRSTLDSVNKSQNIANNFIENISNVAKESLNKVEDKIEENLQKVEDKIGTSVKDKINKIENNISNLSNKNIQKGGLKKIHKEKKEIENRINKSLHEFLYLRPSQCKKTRRIKL
jgi:hypothetical protein